MNTKLLNPMKNLLCAALIALCPGTLVALDIESDVTSTTAIQPMFIQNGAVYDIVVPPGCELVVNRDIYVGKVTVYGGGALVFKQDVRIWASGEVDLQPFSMLVLDYGLTLQELKNLYAVGLFVASQNRPSEQNVYLIAYDSDGEPWMNNYSTLVSMGGYIYYHLGEFRPAQ